MNACATFDFRVASMDPPASPSLLRNLTINLRRGNDEAWEEFHRQFGRDLFRYLLGLTQGDEDAAREVLQQTYFRVARYVRPSDSASSFLSCLQLIARNALSDHRRGQTRFWQWLQRHRLDIHEVAWPGARGNDQLEADLDVALTRIDPDDRALLEAKYFARRQVSGIAEELGISSKAVESRLTRARAELRRQLVQVSSNHE